jgi:hypothetical protein
MTWPVRWFLPVETALNVYEVLTTMNRAMSTLKGEELAKWKLANSRLVQAALDIQANRDEREAAENG